ncbi:YjbE family putative metal transport protein [Sphingobium yanoikuyae]|uniref:YjbE family putative metal transport protein n=1 Tax=Sphingobium yanoikuyae TaxID=13690 RepID=UPI0028A6E471|nr:YjbE family putative metal transport protein [Sphingobium yanoikuyae]
MTFGVDAVLALLQVFAIDVVLAGDNAVAVGLAAAGLVPEQRRKAVAIGLAVAVAVRIGFALVAVELLHVTGLLLAGGLLLAWVCWKMWRDLRASAEAVDDDSGSAPAKSFGSAIVQILIADVSMSLDNILAVAGAARDHPALLVVGLLLSIALMGVAATWIARQLERHRWIGYLGLAVVAIVAGRMIVEGLLQLQQAA